MPDRLTLMPAARRRAFIRIDNRTIHGPGSPLVALSDKTKALCEELFAEGLIELRIEPDGSQRFRTTELGRKIRSGNR